nr:uncharacterized protein LOC116768496 [Danaus plexippus plexippus]
MRVTELHQLTIAGGLEPMSIRLAGTSSMYLLAWSKGKYGRFLVGRSLKPALVPPNKSSFDDMKKIRQKYPWESQIGEAKDLSIGRCKWRKRGEYGPEMPYVREKLQETGMYLFPGSFSLKNVYMMIPEAVERGKPAVIKCMYDLEKEDLYQVKWYRGDREFCRYSPRDVPPLKVFPISGIDVDRDASDAKQVTIKAATKRAHGRYTCEVSADAPSFLTAQMHGFMHVVDLPKSDPELIGLKKRYKPGMKLKVECISYDSMPPANLSFFVNSEPALSQHVWHRVSGGENGSLWTAYSTIQFTVQKHHFVRSKIKNIPCLKPMMVSHLSRGPDSGL